MRLLGPCGRARLLAPVALLAAPVLHAQVPARDTARTVTRDSARSATRPATLEAVRVTATREGPRAPIELPYAVTLTRPDSLAALRRQGVDELLFAVPGVALANRQNPAQDPRVSIRGFGARSAFGVRGVRVLQDGVPLTLPDGQTPVDVVDVEGADRVEVVRGSASSLYGNAAGGVIDVRSAAAVGAVVAPFARIVGGGSVPTITAAGAGGTLGPLGYTSSVTRIVGRGYRDYSDQRATRGALRLLLRTPTGARARPHARRADLRRGSRREPGRDHAGAVRHRPALGRSALGAQAGGQDRAAGRSRAHRDAAAGRARRARRHGLRERAHARQSAHLRRRARRPLERWRVGATEQRTARWARMPCASRRAAISQWQNDDRQEYEACIDAAAPTATCPTPRTQRGDLRKNQRELVSSVGPVRARRARARAVAARVGRRARRRRALPRAATG